MRTNADPVVGRDGWAEISPEPFSGEVPAIPEWVGVGPVGEAVYAELSRLPQAALYGPGTWFELHMSLRLVERYLERPGSENFKAIIATLGAALRLTEDDLQKSRVRIKAAETDDTPSAAPSRVSDLAARRARLTGA